MSETVKEWSLPAHTVSGAAVISNGEGKYLLVKHPRRGWEIPGGIIDEGESVIEGTLREVREEAGVEVEITGFAGFYQRLNSVPGHNGVKIIPPTVDLVFKAKYVSGEPHISEEHLDIGWFTADGALKAITHANMHLKFENALQNGIFHGTKQGDSVYDGYFIG